MSSEDTRDTLIAAIRPGPDGAAVAAASAHLYVDLRGTIELLSESTCLVIGQFETALFLLPDLASLADGLARLRDGAQTVQIVLLESPELRLVRPRRQPLMVEIHYAGNSIAPISVEQLDSALEAAVKEFFEWLLATRPTSGIDASSMSYVEVVASVWRTIEPLVAVWRRLPAPYGHV